MSKKKTVKAPLTHNPGKGRPKEHLAYLNYQEMEALKRLNGRNVERGPKGLPSFAFAGPSSSLSAPARTAPSTGAVKSTSTPRGNTGSYPSRGTVTTPSKSTTTSTGARGPTGPQGQARTSPAGGTPGAVTRSSSSGASSNSRVATSSNRDIGVAGVPGGVNRTGTSLAPRATSSGAASATSSNRDTVVRQTVANDQARSATTNRSLQQDTSKSGVRSINVGPMGTPVTIGKVSGTISSLSQQAKKPALKASPVAGPFAPAPEKYKTAADTQQAMVRDLVQNKLRARYGTNYSQAQADKLVAAIMGESAGENAFGQAAVANTMLNRMALANANIKKYGYLGGGDFDALMAQYDATGMSKRSPVPNAPFTKAIPGSKLYGEGIVALNQALGQDTQFAREASPAVRSATHFYNPATSSPNWPGMNKFETVGGHRFGTAEPIAKQVFAAQRVALENERISKDNAARARAVADFASPEKTQQFSDAGIRKTAAPYVAPKTAAAAAVLAENVKKIPVLAAGFFGGTPAAAPVENYVDPAVAAGRRPQAYAPPAQTARAYDPLTSVKAPTAAQTVALEPMETPQMPGRPENIVKTDVYTVKKGSVPPAAEKTIASVLADPSKIVSVAKADDWGVQDPKKLAEIKNDISKLKDLGVKVQNGQIVIPKAAAQKAQSTFNKIAKAYSPMFGGAAPGYGQSFKKGLGTITEKSTIAETKPPTAAQLSNYDMAMSDYRDAMRGLAMSPSLQKPGDVYAGAVPTPRGIAAIQTGTPAGPFGAPLPNANLQFIDQGGPKTDTDRVAPSYTGVMSPYLVSGNETIIGKIPGATPVSPRLPKTINGYEVYNPSDYENSLAIVVPSATQSLPPGFESSENISRSLADGTDESTALTYDPDQRPRYVSPEEWDAAVRQTKTNKIVLGGAEYFPMVGGVVSLLNTGVKAFTGKTPAELSLDLKRTYLQASPEERLAMQQKYPDMRRFARSIGDVPSETNVVSGPGVVQRPGAGFPTDTSGSSRDQISSSRDLVTAATGGTTSPDTGEETAQPLTPARPYEYYEWDLGVNIPSPGDAKYNEFQGYLAERAAAQAAMYT